MDEIQRQVGRVWRRLVWQQFVGVASWSLFGALLAAAVAVAASRLWPLPVERSLWAGGWLAGAIGGGLAVALLWTYRARKGPLEAAMELDHRYGLKERVASSLALGPDERETVAGRALIQDTAGRLARIDPVQRFGFRWSWPLGLPLLPAALFGVLLLVPDAVRDPGRAVAEGPDPTQRQVKRATEVLKNKVAQQRSQAEAQGLKDAEMLLNKLEQGLDQLQNKDQVGRRQALVRINDLARELDQRRQGRQGADKMRRQLEALKNIQRGPADRITDALKQGDFRQARQELQRLQQQLQKGELDEQQQQQLAQQLEQMRQKLQDLARAHEQAKRDLEQQIQQELAAGDRQQAGRLQQQLDQLNQQDQHMDRLQQMADQMGQCAECLQDGQLADAASQLAEVGDQLQQLQQQLDELQTIDELMDQIAQAKEAINCDQCQGEGCQGCLGEGLAGGFNPDAPPGVGMGEGQGMGDRPEEKTDTKHYESRVRGTMRPGEAIRAGDADGPNVAGRSQEQVKNQVLSALGQEADPLTTQRLPRSQREHTRQYFERFRQGDPSPE